MRLKIRGTIRKIITTDTTQSTPSCSSTCGDGQRTGPSRGRCERILRIADIELSTPCSTEPAILHGGVDLMTRRGAGDAGTKTRDFVVEHEP